MLNFSHTYLHFKDLIRTYFCEIYVFLWDLNGIKKTSFSILKIPARLHWRSIGRSTGPGVGNRTSRLMCTRTYTWPAYSAGRPRGRPTESTQLSGAGRSIGGTTVRNMTIALVDRAVNWKVIFDLSRLPTGRFFWGYK